jgi:integrase/recombinase XerD
MKSLAKGVNDYLAIRRALGFKLQGYERDLNSFVQFLKEKRSSRITTALVLEWVKISKSKLPSEWTRRLCHIRGFAQYWRAIDSRTDVPAWALLPFHSKRARPYIYTADEISKLLEAALRLHPPGGLRSWTYYTLIGLLVATGMRLGEVINLQPEDVNLTEGVLTVKNAKFGKSRLVPLHPSTTAVLANYAVRRDRFLGKRPAVRFLISQRAKKLAMCVVHFTFYQLSLETGLRKTYGGHGPRFHDFRHRFAIETLLHWYRSGEDVERRLPILSTYLGHVRIEDTYWYLRACPELMGLAVARLENHWRRRS